MPPKKAAATVKDVVAKDAATFDVGAWLNSMSERGYKPRNVPVKLHVRGDLLPRINQLIEQIQSDADIDHEAGVNDRDPMGALIAEYEQLSAEFEAGGHVDFVFRPMTRRVHNDTYKAWLERYPGEEQTTEQWDQLVLLRMVATCVDFPGRGAPGVGDNLSTEALEAFEEHYGTPAFNTLVAGWSEAYASGGEVAAPFSPKPSPTPGTEGSSSS